MIITLPFVVEKLEKETLLTHCVENGTFKVECRLTWPVYQENGAGQITHLNVDLIFIDNHGNKYNLEKENMEM